jgi:hypothetical protein
MIVPYSRLKSGQPSQDRFYWDARGENRFFKEVDSCGRLSGRVAAIKTKHPFPGPKTLHRWQMVETAYADNKKKTLGEG